MDDALVVFAYILLLVFASFWQAYSKDIYTVNNVAAGLEAPGPDIMTRFQGYLNGEIFTLFMYGFSLWSIKLSFLLFFRRLGYQVRYQALLWWGVLMFNIATFFIWFGVANWRCIALSVTKVKGTKVQRLFTVKKIDPS